MKIHIVNISAYAISFDYRNKTNQVTMNKIFAYLHEHSFVLYLYLHKKNNIYLIF